MLERDGYPAGVPCWVDTAQPDPEAAVRFYGGLFGWEFEDRMPADAPGRYFVARLRGRDVAAVGSLPEGMPPTPAWTTYVWVDSADEAAGEGRGGRRQGADGPFDVGDAGRMAVLADPEGAVFGVWQAGSHRGAQLVNEPGTWNFNELNTRDPEGAQAFYGAVFGWEASTSTGEGGLHDVAAPRLRRLPGGARSRHARAHGERGRARGLRGRGRHGWSPMGADQDGPPHWSITFAVDDADAAAARAVELGGEVLVPPFDAPWVRMTVLRDPQGAVFTASKFVPPES